MKLHAGSGRWWRATAVGLVALGVLSCGAREETPAVDAARLAEARARAERACDELGQRLLAELTAALAAGSTLEGLEVCARVAQGVGDELRSASGVEVGRTSLRVRNPANAPDAFERAQLERWETAARAGEPIDPWVGPVPAADGAHELRYLRPIRLVELCTRCHGRPEDLEPEVRSALARLYPADQATGYAPGELRGAFSARVPLGP